METLNIKADNSELDAVNDFLSENLENLDVPMKVIMQIQLAAEEIFTNISNYGYGEEKGSVTVNFSSRAVDDNSEIVIEFIDEGMPFNPLEKDDPDIDADVEDRDIGGLGIYMVKNIMDSVEYRFEQGKNVLKLTKLMEGN